MIGKSTALLLIVLTSFNFLNCKEDHNTVVNCGEFSFYHDVKSFGSFTEGTYWIYQNQLTQEVDTFTVIENLIGHSNGVEDRFRTRISRTFDNDIFIYNHEGYNNINQPGNPCEIMRIWMIRIGYNDNDQATGTEQASLHFPVIVGKEFPSLCGTNSAEATVVEIYTSDVLQNSNVEIIRLEGTAFTLNPCTGDHYSYEFGTGIGLISWENLDLMDGKWMLIEFEPNL